MYVLSRLYTFQNLREAFLVKADTDIAEYVSHSTELLHGNRVYLFSRELLACLETMVAFSPYHVANDPFVALPMEPYYDEALARFKKVQYDKLHEYITEGLVEWYGRFKPDADADAADDKEELEDGEDGEEEVNAEVDAVTTAPTEALSSGCNLTRKSIKAQAPAAAAAAAAPAPAPAAAGPAQA
jgi:hypothetical protein